MSQTAVVDGMLLTVPEGWWIWKYDDSVFHRSQFQNFAGGCKALDAIALSADGTLWLIELKDYRRYSRTNPSSIASEMAAKVRATLAGLAVARVRANDTQERTLARKAMKCLAIRVALQVAQSTNPSRLFPQVIDPQNARMKLRRELRTVDAHPYCVVGDITARGLPWTTQPEPPAAP